MLDLFNKLKEIVRTKGNNITWFGNVGLNNFNIELVGEIENLVDIVREIGQEIKLSGGKEKDNAYMLGDKKVVILPVKIEDGKHTVEIIAGNKESNMHEAILYEKGLLNVNDMSIRLKKNFENAGFFVWGIWTELPQQEKIDTVFDILISFKEKKIRFDATLKSNKFKINNVRIPRATQKEDYTAIMTTIKDVLKNTDPISEEGENLMDEETKGIKESKLNEREMKSASVRIISRARNIQQGALSLLGIILQNIIRAKSQNKLDTETVSREQLDRWFSNVDELKADYEAFLKLEGLTEGVDIKRVQKFIDKILIPELAISLDIEPNEPSGNFIVNKAVKKIANFSVNNGKIKVETKDKRLIKLFKKYIDVRSYRPSFLNAIFIKEIKPGTFEMSNLAWESKVNEAFVTDYSKMNKAAILLQIKQVSNQTRLKKQYDYVIDNLRDIPEIELKKLFNSDEDVIEYLKDVDKTESIYLKWLKEKASVKVENTIKSEQGKYDTVFSSIKDISNLNETFVQPKSIMTDDMVKNFLKYNNSDIVTTTTGDKTKDINRVRAGLRNTLLKTSGQVMGQVIGDINKYIASLNDNDIEAFKGKVRASLPNVSIKKEAKTVNEEVIHGIIDSFTENKKSYDRNETNTKAEEVTSGLLDSLMAG